MKPGRELDVLVAEKVMGLQPVLRPHSFWQDDGSDHFPTDSYLERYPDQRKWFTESEWAIPHGVADGTVYGWKRAPHYSTKIEDAWGVVEWIWKNSAWGQDLVVGQDHVAWEHGYDGYEISEYGESAPHAICIGALRLVGEYVGSED